MSQILERSRSMKKRFMACLAVLAVLMTVVCSPLSAVAAYPLSKDRSITAKSAVVDRRKPVIPIRLPTIEERKMVPI